jgi:SAM-dependent methyltransferase
VKSLLRKVLLALAAPVRGFFDPRFRDLGHGLDEARQLARDTNARMAELEARVTSDTQTSAEFATTFRRSTDRLRDDLHTMWSWATAGLEPGLADLLARSSAGDREADAQLGKILHDLVPGAADRVVGAFEGVRLPIGPGTADFLNWAGGHNGPAAQAGMWFNPAVVVNHNDGTVRPGDVNERIVEVPWVMGLATSLEPGSLVLDFGATESTVSLSLASLGLDVIAADLRPYPLSHPRIHSLTGPIEQWDGPDRPLDAVVCVSALEHVGIGAYDEAPTEGELDREIVQRFAQWLRPGGEIAFTAPYGHWEVNDLQRIYDAEHLEALFAGWRVTQRAICVQTASDRWERADGEPPWSTWDDGTRGVVLLRATPEK